MKLSDLAGHISEEFVRRVLEQMHEMRREFDEPHMRIAPGSSDRSPDYEIMSVHEDKWVMITLGFRGKTHRPMPDEVRQRTIWSGEYMTIPEVAELRQAVRNRK